MHRQWIASATAVACLFASQQAAACRESKPINLEDATSADVIVVGQISNYHIVRDEEFRRKMLARPDLSPDLRKLYSDKGASLTPDYAAFDVLVDEVLKGKAPSSVRVTWDNMTSGELEEMPSGPFLIALLKASSTLPPASAPRITFSRDPDPSAMMVLVAPCAGPFIFPSTGDEARKIRAQLGVPLK